MLCTRRGWANRKNTNALVCKYSNYDVIGNHLYAVTLRKNVIFSPLCTWLHVYDKSVHSIALSPLHHACPYFNTRFVLVVSSKTGLSATDAGKSPCVLPPWSLQRDIRASTHSRPPRLTYHISTVPCAIEMNVVAPGMDAISLNRPDCLELTFFLRMYCSGYRKFIKALFFRDYRRYINTRNYSRLPLLCIFAWVFVTLFLKKSGRFSFSLYNNDYYACLLRTTRKLRDGFSMIVWLPSLWIRPCEWRHSHVTRRLWTCLYKNQNYISYQFNIQMQIQLSRCWYWFFRDFSSDMVRYGTNYWYRMWELKPDAMQCYKRLSPQSGYGSSVYCTWPQSNYGSSV